MKRTFYLSFLYLSIIFLAVHCKDHHAAEGDKIRHSFDSINQQLRSLNQTIDQSTQSLYDSVAAKYTKTFLEQFNYTINDCKNYLADLKVKFLKYCGDPNGQTLAVDKENNIEMTNQFFSKDEVGITLYHKLADVQRIMSGHNDDPALDSEILKLTILTEKEGPGKFMELYFNDVPPLSALTILTKFDHDIDRLEKRVLQEILKDHNVSQK